MIVTREDAHQALGLDKRFHKDRVGAAVIAIIIAVAYITLMTDHLFIKTRCFRRVATSVLEGSSGMNRDVYESQTRNNTALLLTDGVACEAEPRSDLGRTFLVWTHVV